MAWSWYRFLSSSMPDFSRLSFEKKGCKSSQVLPLKFNRLSMPEIVSRLYSRQSFASKSANSLASKLRSWILDMADLISWFPILSFDSILWTFLNCVQFYIWLRELRLLEFSFINQEMAGRLLLQPKHRHIKLFNNWAFSELSLLRLSLTSRHNSQFWRSFRT